jgi:hypothetical protein
MSEASTPNFKAVFVATVALSFSSSLMLAKDISISNATVAGRSFVIMLLTIQGPRTVSKKELHYRPKTAL